MLFSFHVRLRLGLVYASLHVDLPGFLQSSSGRSLYVNLNILRHFSPTITTIIRSSRSSAVMDFSVSNFLCPLSAKPHFHGRCGMKICPAWSAVRKTLT